MKNDFTPEEMEIITREAKVNEERISAQIEDSDPVETLMVALPLMFAQMEHFEQIGVPQVVGQTQLRLLKLCLAKVEADGNHLIPDSPIEKRVKEMELRWNAPAEVVKVDEVAKRELALAFQNVTLSAILSAPQAKDIPNN
jgi:hypothetical protein